MYKWTTTTIINSNEDFGKGTPLFEGKDDPASLFVKRVNKFLKPNVLAIYLREHNDAELAEVTIDLSGVTNPGVYRIALYIGLQGSANEYYANDFVFKGKPFFIEFERGANSTGLGDKVVRIAKKYLQMVYENPLIEISNKGNTLTLKATDEYQRFRMVELLKYDEEAGMHQSCCANAGDFVTIDSIDKNNVAYTGKIVLVKEGKEGFGTYRHLIKDLRLPTMENRKWGGIIQDETPIVGATYDLYIIYYCTTVGVQGLAHVGDMVQAATTHVFYVNTNIKSEWETALKNIGEPTTVTDAGHTVNPYTVLNDLITKVDHLSKVVSELES